MSEIDISKQDDQDATLRLALFADSGYQSTQEVRVSARQWAAILGVALGTIDPAEALKLVFAPDDELVTRATQETTP